MPWVLVFYGPRIRARSKFASVSDLLDLNGESSADSMESRKSWAKPLEDSLIANQLAGDLLSLRFDTNVSFLKFPEVSLLLSTNETE